MLRTLPFREQTVLRFRYGIGMTPVRTRGEIAAIFKLTPERIRQVESAALRALRVRLSGPCA